MLPVAATTDTVISLARWAMPTALLILLLTYVEVTVKLQLHYALFSPE